VFLGSASQETFSANMSKASNLLKPNMYHHQPWKNGGGVSTTIAAQPQPQAHSLGDDWSNMIWQLGRTQIVSPGAFSDLSGFERLQIVVCGHGLVLRTPDKMIDLRMPLVPVRYDGGIPIVSELEDGPVDVVNLMARRDACHIDLIVLHEKSSLLLPAAEHIVYAPRENSRISLEGIETELVHDHALQFNGDAILFCTMGVVLVASVAQF
jgi:environmental stress-induced protein Ves